MKITITGIISELLKAKVGKAVQFYASELMSTRMCNTLTITVDLSTVDKKAVGTMYKTCIGSEKQKDFFISIDPTLPNEMLFEVLAHEMVHVKQSAKGEYQLRLWKSDKKVHARWRGTELGVFEQIPYNQRPWEVEAYAMEAELFKKAKKKLKI
jgi:hypothetical protein